MEKEYGKLTESQFKRLIGALPEFRKGYAEFERAIRGTSKEKLAVLIDGGVYWAPLYELPFMESLAWLLLALGEHERVQAISKLPDPQEAVLRELENGVELVWNGGAWGAFTRADVVGLATVLQRNVLSIMVHKRSLCSLIEDARETGNDKSLFDAIRIDRTVVCSPTAAARISKAELLGQKQFFIRLRAALKGPSKKHWEALRDLRYSLFVLREFGFEKLTDDQLEHLLVKILKVYPSTPTARKNLREQYHQSRRIKAL